MKTGLKVAALLALAVFLASPLAAEEQRNPSSLAGTWIVDVSMDGFGFLTYLQEFTHDGRSTIIVASGAVEGGFDETRSGCVGEWQRAGGPHIFDVTMYCLWTDQDFGVMPDRIRIKATLDGNGQHWSAPFVYEQYDEASGEWVSGVELHMESLRLGIIPYEP